MPRLQQRDFERFPKQPERQDLSRHNPEFGIMVLMPSSA